MAVNHLFRICEIKEGLALTAGPWRSAPLKHYQQSVKHSRSQKTPDAEHWTPGSLRFWSSVLISGLAYRLSTSWEVIYPQTEATDERQIWLLFIGSAALRFSLGLLWCLFDFGSIGLLSQLTSKIKPVSTLFVTWCEKRQPAMIMQSMLVL